MAVLDPMRVVAVSRVGTFVDQLRLDARRAVAQFRSPFRARIARGAADGI
jgi:hypothetical protein